MWCHDLLGGKCSFREGGADVQLIGLQCSGGGSSWVGLEEEKSVMAPLPQGG